MRIREFDVAKGFAISVVVFVHATFFNFGKLYPFSQTALMIISTFLAPAIAIFFFVSGFFGYRSYIKRKSFKAFESQKFKAILPPYITWSTIYLLLQAGVGQIVGQPYVFRISSAIEKYLLGEAFLPFYYVIVLMIFYLLTPYFSKLKEKEVKALLLLSFIAGLFVVGLYFVPLYFKKEYVSSLITYRNPFTWMFFYVWGMYLAKNNKTSWRKQPSILTIIGFFVTYAFALLEMETVPKLNADWESYLILGPGVYIFYFFAIKVYLWISYRIYERNKLISRAFVALGKNSFGIYLSHGLILYVILGIAVTFNSSLLNESNVILNSLAGMIGVVTCYAFSQVINKSPTLIKKTLI